MLIQAPAVPLPDDKTCHVLRQYIDAGTKALSGFLCLHVAVTCENPRQARIGR